MYCIITYSLHGFSAFPSTCISEPAIQRTVPNEEMSKPRVLPNSGQGARPSWHSLQPSKDSLGLHLAASLLQQ